MTARKRKYTRLAPSQWEEIGAHWASGDHTLAELSARFGVSERAIQNQLAKRGVRKGEKAAEMAAAVKEEVFKTELDDKDTTVARAKDIRESAYADATTMQGLVRAQLELAQKGAPEAFRAGATLKALSLAAATLERLHGTRLRALGLDKDNPLPDEMPELVFRDISQEEIDTMRKSQESEAEDFGPSRPIDTAAVATPEAGNDEIVVEGMEPDGEIVVEGVEPDDEVVVEGEPTEEIAPTASKSANDLATSLAVHGGRLVRGYSP